MQRMELARRKQKDDYLQSNTKKRGKEMFNKGQQKKNLRPREQERKRRHIQELLVV